jgi:hypothetical protein
MDRSRWMEVCGQMEVIDGRRCKMPMSSVAMANATRQPWHYETTVSFTLMVDIMRRDGGRQCNGCHITNRPGAL